MASSIFENVTRIHQDIDAACKRVGRDPRDVQLVAVSKTVAAERIAEAIACGVTVFGESRVQELAAKVPQLPAAAWHLIGHLQTNKVKYIYDKVALIHSLDRLALAEELDKYANRLGRPLGRPIEVLVQVNVAKESTKYGLFMEDVVPFLRQTLSFEGVQVRGLMTIGPWDATRDEIRAVFRGLREKAEEIKGLHLPRIRMDHLSMGMTGDYDVAVEEGATLVRIGSGVFGQR